MSKLNIYNSMENKKVVFNPIDSENVRVYACGPTVYDYPHIGNARMAVVFDTLVRLLKHLYPKVTYVSNITDIDDKIIEKSNIENLPVTHITEKFSKIYNNDMRMLNVKNPDFQPKATEYINKMVEAIIKLEKQNFAYYSEGHIFFNITSFKNYGFLASRKKEDELAGSRVKISSYKKNPGDFVLWKPSKENEPSWNSPWGKGRPGWHTECFVMATEILGTPFDIHGGGLDLKFPHHENELAQSCCYSGNLNNKTSYAKYWMHNGFVTIEAEKMSKSLGNIKLVKDYLKSYNGEVIRLALLSAHYRSPLNWSEQVLIQSKNILSKYNKILQELKSIEIDYNDKDNIIIVQIMDALKDDLNISRAFNALDVNIKNINKKNNEEKKSIKQAIQFLGSIIGIFEENKSTESEKFSDFKEINILIKKRNEARKNKDFELADNIRNKLIEMNVEIEDHPDGTRWKEI